MPGEQSTQPDPAAAAAWPSGRPPFRADHAGSLLRPAEVLRARGDPAAGRTAPEVWGTW
jgi:5-methyltetrahydropteroyltriglutamate--homocysteine methyltransferase